MFASAVFYNEPARVKRLFKTEVIAAGDKAPVALAAAFAAAC